MQNTKQDQDLCAHAWLSVKNFVLNIKQSVNGWWRFFINGLVCNISTVMAWQLHIEAHMTHTRALSKLAEVTKCRAMTLVPEMLVF